MSFPKGAAAPTARPDGPSVESRTNARRPRYSVRHGERKRRVQPAAPMSTAPFVYSARGPSSFPHARRSDIAHRTLWNRRPRLRYFGRASTQRVSTWRRQAIGSYKVSPPPPTPSRLRHPPAGPAPVSPSNRRNGPTLRRPVRRPVRRRAALRVRRQDPARRRLDHGLLFVRLAAGVSDSRPVARAALRLPTG